MKFKDSTKLNKTNNDDFILKNQIFVGLPDVTDIECLNKMESDLTSLLNKKNYFILKLDGVRKNNRNSVSSTNKSESDKKNSKNLTNYVETIYSKIDFASDKKCISNNFIKNNEYAIEFLKNNSVKFLNFIKKDKDINKILIENFENKRFYYSFIDKKDIKEDEEGNKIVSSNKIRIGSGQINYQNIFLKILLSHFFEDKNPEKYIFIKWPENYLHNNLLFKTIINIKKFKNLNFKIITKSKYFLNYFFNTRFFNLPENENKYQLIINRNKYYDPIFLDIFNFINDKENTILSKQQFREVFFESLFWKKIIFCSGESVYTRAKKLIKDIKKINDYDEIFENCFLICFKPKTTDLTSFIKKTKLIFFQKFENNFFLFFEKENIDKLKEEINISENIENICLVSNKKNDKELKEKIKFFLLKKE